MASRSSKVTPKPASSSHQAEVRPTTPPPITIASWMPWFVTFLLSLRLVDLCVCGQLRVWPGGGPMNLARTAITAAHVCGQSQVQRGASMAASLPQGGQDALLETGQGRELALLYLRIARAAAHQDHKAGLAGAVEQEHRTQAVGFAQMADGGICLFKSRPPP